MKVTSKYKGIKRTKMWVVLFPNGTTRGFKAHEYTKRQVLEIALNTTPPQGDSE